MIQGILFDMGGTLDGDGHWLDRFVVFYKKCGLDLSRELIREAFDEADRRAAVDKKIAIARQKEMLELHVGWQLAHLGLKQDSIKECLVEKFAASVFAVTARNERLLRDLAKLGFRLGIVSNGCGNTATLSEEFGYAPHLSVIVDSRRAGLFKPDPAIFLHAVRELGCDPETILMVGDSFERDIRPAKSVGMKTAWLEGTTECPAPALVDIRLQRLADLPAALSATSFATA
jgi:putative hydrolase of the HAD superfamily